MGPRGGRICYGPGLAVQGLAQRGPPRRDPLPHRRLPPQVGRGQPGEKHRQLGRQCHPAQPDEAPPGPGRPAHLLGEAGQAHGQEQATFEILKRAGRVWEKFLTVNLCKKLYK